MRPITNPTTEEPRLRATTRIQVAEFDHDCEGGHGPRCQPIACWERWLLEDDPVTDPSLLAQLKEQLEEA